MDTLLIALASFSGFIIAYHTYGRWLARKIFNLDARAEVPSQQLRDDIDYIPSKKEVVFGHHFTSIAGTGPIVGPAIAVFWGWLPALLWVTLGPIFIGAVHDFGSLVVSLRNRGQTIGQVAGRLVSPRAKLLFLLVLLFALTIVIAIFGLVIAVIFSKYPQSVLSVWIEIPLAIFIGFWVYRRGGGLFWASVTALAVMYLCVLIGVYFLPIKITPIAALGNFGSPVVVWTVILLAYCFFASTLPVWVLLQPRDYINSHQLFIAMGLLVVGLMIAGATGAADLAGSAPAINDHVPADAPPIWPFLFITIACGACSGFHCLVSSGTSSKQLSCESDARYVGYGSMLLEGALATVVILACCAGLGMGVSAGGDGGTTLSGREAWHSYYSPEGSWADFGLPKKVGAFVDGGANFIAVLGIPLEVGIAIVAVLVASFAATTLDTATRLQRYVIQELSSAINFKPLTNKYAATGFALIAGGALAMLPAPGKGPGTGGLILWPLFGATNQLLAGLAFTVIVFYLLRRNLPFWFALIPMIIMLIIPGWAMIDLTVSDFLVNEKYPLYQRIVLTGFGVLITVLQIWMVMEALLMWPRAKGILEEALPPLAKGKSVAITDRSPST